MKTIDLAPGTDTGRQRQDNQDRFIAKKLWTDSQALLAVIDGVGGYEGGDVAATIAQESLEYYMSSPKGDVLSMLKEAVILANNQVIEKKESDPKMAQMCCVLTAVVADAKKQVLQYVHVGDTRLYRFRNGILEKITNDHSLVGVREDAGELSEAEAMRHPRRNVILRQVGTEVHRIDDPDFLEFGEIEFLSGDILLLCSDGLSDLVTKDQITSLLNKRQPLTSTVTELIGSANKAGGTDNVTVVLVKNTSKAKPAQQIETVGGPVPVSEEKENTIIQESKTDIIKTSPPANKLTNTLLIALLLAILTLAGIWLIRTPSAPKPKLATTQVDSSKNIIRKIPDSLLNLEPDTIRLKSTIELNKSGLVTGSKVKTTVLVPAIAFDSSIAIKIVNIPGKQAENDTIWLKDLIIQGFETGISVERNSILYLDNVLFKNVAHPVSYRSSDSTKIKNLRFE